MSSTSGTRGIRSNNPGNIDYNASIKWKGQIGKETGVPNPRFIRFSMPEYGIRAMAKILLTYYDKHHIRTVDGIVGRWAPPSENDTGSYAQSVASKLGVEVDAIINVHHMPVMLALVKAIITHENGEQPYSENTITKGINMAGVA